MRGSFGQVLPAGVLMLVVALATLVAFTALRNRSCQVDEIGHVHSASSVSEGRVLCRDFWEGHNRHPLGSAPSGVPPLRGAPRRGQSLFSL